MSALKIVHFSDVLCVWAYIGQASLLRLVEKFGDKIDVEEHFCSIFPDTQTKINKAWRDRGGFGGYADHVKMVAKGIENMGIHDDVWSRVQPKSSASPHLFIKAIELLEYESPEGTAFDRLSNRAAKELRSAFFAEAQDISDWAVQRIISEKIGIAFDEVLKKIETGEAIAKLAADYELAQSLRVQGSPTYMLNEGRQILFGNVSYNILEANVAELLAEKRNEIGSGC